MNRRKFLASSAAASAIGLAADSRTSATSKKLLLPSDTPDEFGLRLMWFNPVPPIDQKTFRLRIKGLVEKPVDIAVADLRRFPQEKQSARMKCVQCWSSRAEWGGFRFANLMELAKPKKTAKAVRIDCADKWYEYFTISEILNPRVLMVLDLAGKPLPDKHGAPLRLLDPSKYGYKSAKLITSIEFVAEGKGSMACDIGPYYSATGEIKAGYDTPLDIDRTGKTRRKITGGEILDY